LQFKKSGAASDWLPPNDVNNMVGRISKLRLRIIKWRRNQPCL
jgi:hypothetical protein